ncbi:MAG: DUF1800 domain-containing protein [Deltaproteobacteria bacterium]|nr:DUF1800 domain-containing protein [Deltaproteobacteria bacterium]
MNALSPEQRTIHFLSRTSFGATGAELERLNRLGQRAYLDEQLTPQKIADDFVEEKIAALKTMRLSARELLELYPQPKQAVNQNMMAPMEMGGPRQVILELQLARLLRAVYSRRQLYEVMVDFWSNHFNIFAAKGADRWLTTPYDRDTIRPQALGKFRDLLLATAQSPAMLFYLDNWLSAAPDSAAQRFAPNNRRRGINENYARELMELHSLGVDGGYTQKDVQEVARCFTGWTIRQPRGEGGFYFEPRIHDNGEKIVLGTRIAAGGGVEDGLQVIDLLARHPSTARFIATKLARRLVADDPLKSLVDKAVGAFRQSDGDIPTTLRAIIESEEFFAPTTYRSKIKKPLEFVASALRVTGAETQITHQLLRYLGRMGEPLFLAQPPTGYPDVAASWISADMLLTRMNFAADLVSNRLPGSRVSKENIAPIEQLVQWIAPQSLSASTRAALDRSSGVDAVVLLLSAPEFQRR